MNNKLNNLLNDFFENADIDFNNEKEMNKKLQEFIKKYNNDELEYEETPLDKAYEILEELNDEMDFKKVNKIADKALKVCPYCLEAHFFKATAFENTKEREDYLRNVLEEEKKRLEKEGIYKKENIGHFYGIFETRPYMQGMYLLLDNLLLDSKIKKSIELCEEALKLNEHDNLGFRYKLMALYALNEDEKSLSALIKKYPDNNLEALFPQFALYFKLEDYEKANKILDKITKNNPNFIKYIKNPDAAIEKEDEMMPGAYQIGGMSEVIMYFEDYSFLTDPMLTLKIYLLDYFKSKKKGK